MNDNSVKNILKKHPNGLNIYSLYIKLRFIKSLDELETILSNKKNYIKVGDKYISKDIERISAELTFFIRYYKTKDIITIHSTAFRKSDGRELGYDEILNKIEYINTPKSLKKTHEIPKHIMDMLKNINIIVESHEFPELILRTIPELEQYTTVEADESLSELDIKDTSIIPTFRIDYDNSGSWLYLYPKYFVGDQLIDTGDADILPTGSFVRKGNAWRRVGYGDKEKFNSIIKQLELIEVSNTNKNCYKLENFKFSMIEELENERELRFSYSSKAKDFIRKLKDFNSIDNTPVPPAVQKAFDKEGIKLRPYQQAGINWLNYLRKCGLNGLVADDMGLGKTIQVITTLANAYELDNAEKPSLVICPKSVIVVWKEQLSRFYPSIRTGAIMGKMNIEDYLNSATATGRIILLTTYETVSYRKSSFLKYDFLYLILDEAQKIKNPQTQMSKAIKQISAVHKVAMTGTPIENHLTELWSIFDFIMRGYLGTKDSFKTRYQKPVSDGNGTVIRKLKQRIEPFKIRRTKRQKDSKTGKSIIQLPELINDKLLMEMNTDQKRLYKMVLSSKETKAIKQRLESGEDVKALSMNIFAILTRLKQICDHPDLLPKDIVGDKNIKSEKFEMLKEKLSEIIESEQKVVIFSQYKSMLKIIEEYLTKNKIGFSKLVGGMSGTQREKHIKQFQNDPNNNYPVFLASLKAGGVGISLTSASNVIHYDRWWNPAVENQATDRVYRSGNSSLIVNVYRLINRNTIEEKIDLIMKRKQALLDNIVKEDSTSGISKTFTKEDILELLTEAY